MRSNLLPILFAGQPPVNTVAPAVTGNTYQGQTLTTTNGTWTGAPSPTYTYQWKRAGSNIGGATSSTYVLVAADVGNTITCTVTATNAAGSVSATTAATASIAICSVTPISWFSARTGCYSDAGTTPCVNNDTVQQMNDSGSASNTLTQATSGNRPTYKTGVQNGNPAILLASPQCLFRTSPSSVPTNTSARSMFVAAQPNTGGNGGIFGYGNSGGQQRFALLINSSTPETSITFSFNRQGNASCPATWNVISMVLPSGATLASQTQIWRDGSSLAVSTLAGSDGAPATTSDYMTIGGNEGAGSFSGYFGEAVLYASELSTTDRQLNEAYLKYVWGTP